MTVDELVGYFPHLYHMASAGSWESIRAHGLLSTTALLDRWEVKGELRRRLESMYRPNSVELHHPRHGRAVIRDQKPINEKKLAVCLEDMEPRAWYELLNRKVFFWLSAERLEKLFQARAYRGKEHLLLTIDTAGLVARHEDRIRLSPINSGAVLYNPPPRGSRTFLPIADYPFEEWKKKRGWQKAVTELTVDYAVPDLADFVLRAEHRQLGEAAFLWERTAPGTVP